ncbi:unnamed protein product, partial [Mesorhabditis belari]|uniref:Galectin n=1 Tax=Mesorhabditis belari TaxID=2138241 RepID=A0AAF3FQV1_9BILA
MSDTDFNIIRNPDVPYTTLIPGGMMPGRSITIKGTVIDNAMKRFHVDLCCGLLIHGDHMDNKALHINPRFEKPGAWPFGGAGDEQIVLNSLINNQWGSEERFINAFKIEEQFTIRILALEEYFKIAVNGKHLCDYEYRVKVDQIKAIHLDGCVRVDYIQFQPAILDGIAQQIAGSPMGPQVLNTLDRPSVPFQLPINGFKPPEIFHITLTPFLSGERFTINFHKGEEWIFHFRVDLPNKEKKEKGCVIRNSTKSLKWGTEERSPNDFPFHKGVTCDLRFTAFQRSIAVDLNGAPYIQFAFRNQNQPTDINLLTVKGDCVIHRIVHKG